MNYRVTETPEMVQLDPALPPTASIIWLHGLGADGHDFVPIVPELHLPETLPLRFVFPHAPRRPVTLNNGYVMPAWYDIRELGGNGAEDDSGIRATEQQLRRWIAAEHARGIAYERIIIAGFSQGGAIALHTALRFPERLAGLLPLSTYLPLRDSLASEASQVNRDLPILMCHGNQDTVVPLPMAQRSRDLLLAQQYKVEFREYPMAHSLCAAQIADIRAWLVKTLT